MNSLRNYTIPVFILFLTCFAGTALAALSSERIRFNSGISPRIQKKILLHLRDERDTGSEDSGIAGADLNRDGIDEFIVDSSGCRAAQTKCTYLILAESGENMIRLGRLAAYNIMLADSYSHGVRDIMAFNNADNDFAHTLYVWEPDRSRYIMAEGGS